MEDHMQTATPTVYYVIGAIVVAAIIVAVAIFASRAARSRRLRQRFGPEYDRTVRTTGDRAAAEQELAARETRVKRMHIEELPAGARERYAEEWRTVQSRFVDQPREALMQADRLVENVMRDRGYPTSDFDQHAADISADHPAVVDDYRAAHGIASRSERGEVSTEDLRQAMVHYRTLFDDLLGTPERTGNERAADATRPNAS
jgi:FtsZ-interacting cell division protein ZipA